MLGRESIVSSFDMCCCIVKDQDVVIVRVVFLNDFNHFFSMLYNVLICIISIPSFSSLEQDTSSFSAIG